MHGNTRYVRALMYNILVGMVAVCVLFWLFLPDQPPWVWATGMLGTAVAASAGTHMRHTAGEILAEDSATPEPSQHQDAQ
jgi:hypothetical protein